MKISKIIFVVGGLFSGIGKGIVSSSIAALIKTTSLKVSIQKIDPYLNIDSGLMNPHEHGEVFVTKDGLETDLDVGNYERFLEEKLTNDSCFTAGQIYWHLLKKERKGEYKGKTINIYDVSNMIKNKIFSFIHKTKCDVLVLELGGTVSDNDLFPFLVAAAQIKKSLSGNNHKSNNVAFVFLTYVNYLLNVGSFKTKPTQNSITSLRNNGIEPNFVILRSFQPFGHSVLKKISKKSYIDIKNIYPLANQENIYQTPLVIHKSKLVRDILNFLNLKASPKITNWKKINEKINFLTTSAKKIKIAIISKYDNFKQSYVSLWHALFASSLKYQFNFEYKEINPSQIENLESAKKILHNFDGILIPGGFGIRGISGKMFAIQYARVYQKPLFGICLGFQLTLIEIANNVLKLPNATSEEFVNSKTGNNPTLIFKYFEPKTKKIFIGERETILKPGTLVAKLYKKSVIWERYRNRFILNKAFQPDFSKVGIVFSAFTKEKPQFSVIFQLKNHPFFIGIQFHCEWNSSLNNSHPLIDAFLDSCWNNKK